jgi:cell division protein FtsB
MSIPTPTPREMLDRLDARHDELIEKLDELNAQIEAALAEFARSRGGSIDELEVRKAA